MPVARLYAAGDIRVAVEARPTPRPSEELVRVEAVGICGSDLHWFGEGAIGDARLAQPLVLGHEMAGRIEGGPRNGERVAIDPAIPCWTCSSCRQGNPNLCLNIVFAGHGGTDGGMRQYLCWPSDRLHRVPTTFDADTVALLEPLGVALHAIDRAKIRVGSVVVVVGCGPIGIFTGQLAKLSGAAHVVAVDPLPHRRELAATFGAIAVDPTDAAGAVAALGDGVGADVAIEFAGTDDAVDCALASVRPGSRVVLGGIPDGDRTTFTASLARRKGLSLVLSRRMGEVYPRCIELVASGQVSMTGLATHGFALDAVADAMAVAASRSGQKVLLHP